jgi:hypothetical protein
MINAKALLRALRINQDSPTRAIQEVRAKVEESLTPLNEANGIIFDITGVQKNYKDVRYAMHIAQSVVIAAITHESFDPDEIIYAAEDAEDKLRKDQDWMFVESGHYDVSTAGKSEQVAFIEGLDVKVAVNADGKLKKGSKGVLAVELYKKHMLEAETPLTNKEFVAILVAQADFTKSGASTYAYNLKTKFGTKDSPVAVKP